MFNPLTMPTVKTSICKKCKLSVRVAVLEGMNSKSLRDFEKEVKKYDLEVKHLDLEEYHDNFIGFCNC